MYRHLQGKEVPYKKSCMLGRKVKLVADKRERIKQRASKIGAGNVIFVFLYFLRGGSFMKTVSVSDPDSLILDPDPAF
jgi:hypothetical protein